MIINVLTSADGYRLRSSDGYLLCLSGAEMELITDRAAGDVERASILKQRILTEGFASLTAEERDEYLRGLKGVYNYTDLNRVEQAVDALAGILRDLPDELRECAAALGVAWDLLFDVPYDPGGYRVTTKTDWATEDTPLPAEMTRYLDNVARLRQALEYATDELPDSMDRLTWEGANAIEWALVRLDEAILELETDQTDMIERTALAWVYSGEIYGDEVTGL